MFEKAFVDLERGGRKPLALLLSSLLQIATLAALVAVPLFYTQVLPRIQLRSVLAAPQLPLPSLPKAPTTVSIGAPRHTVSVFSPVIAVPPEHRSAMPDPPPTATEIGGPGTPYPTGGPETITGAAPPPGPPPNPVAKAAAPKTLHVTQMEPSQLIRTIQPLYPPIAKAARIQGMVEFTATIGKDGEIENLQVVRGHGLLIKAAEEAIRQWRYKPTLLNGEPVEVITVIKVNFTLSQ